MGVRILTRRDSCSFVFLMPRRKRSFWSSALLSASSTDSTETTGGTSKESTIKLTESGYSSSTGTLPPFQQPSDNGGGPMDAIDKIVIITSRLPAHSYWKRPPTSKFAPQRTGCEVGYILRIRQSIAAALMFPAPLRKGSDNNNERIHSPLEVAYRMKAMASSAPTLGECPTVLSHTLLDENSSTMMIPVSAGDGQGGGENNRKPDVEAVMLAIELLNSLSTYMQCHKLTSASVTLDNADLLNVIDNRVSRHFYSALSSKELRKYIWAAASDASHSDTGRRKRRAYHYPSSAAQDIAGAYQEYSRLPPSSQLRSMIKQCEAQEPTREGTGSPVTTSATSSSIRILRDLKTRALPQESREFIIEGLSATRNGDNTEGDPNDSQGDTLFQRFMEALSKGVEDAGEERGERV
eukprot:GHVU01084801.1.p1 GENE.GHVU01084801.1~~GHVU01084801.1.p1  ORF type:complete len:409 (-),score=32.99 GHVU01084801.1:248-1474(-)